MAEIVNAAFFPAGTITVGTDGYKAAVTSAELVPTTPTEVIRDIGGQKPSSSSPASGVMDRIFGLLSCSPYIQSSLSPLVT